MAYAKDAPLEKTIQANIIREFTRRGWYIKKHHSGSYGGQGTPDLYGCADGRFFGIEVKRPGYSPSDVTPLQREGLARIERAGGLSFVATSASEAVELMRNDDSHNHD